MIWLHLKDFYNFNEIKFYRGDYSIDWSINVAMDSFSWYNDQELHWIFGGDDNIDNVIGYLYIGDDYEADKQTLFSNCSVAHLVFLKDESVKLYTFSLSGNLIDKGEASLQIGKIGKTSGNETYMGYALLEVKIACNTNDVANEIENSLNMIVRKDENDTEVRIPVLVLFKDNGEIEKYFISLMNSEGKFDVFTYGEGVLLSPTGEMRHISIVLDRAVPNKDVKIQITNVPENSFFKRLEGKEVYLMRNGKMIEELIDLKHVDKTNTNEFEKIDFTDFFDELFSLMNEEKGFSWENISNVLIEDTSPEDLIAYSKVIVDRI